MGGLFHTGLLGLPLLATWIGCAFAEPASFPEPMERLRLGLDETYADLVRLVVPGITVDAGRYSRGRTIAVRDIGGKNPDGLGPASTEFIRVAAIPVRSGGPNRTALLLDFGMGQDVVGYAILALFDVTDGPRLLDAANVAFGDHTIFLDPVRLPVGAGADLLVTQSTHSNSSQGYTTTALILARDDRFELVDTIFAFSERACAYERTQQIDVRQDVGERPADISASVTETIADTGERCDGVTALEPGTREITVTYRWDAAADRYMPDSDAFEVLARENEERF
ncbi:hypothetical protein [Mesorhizobium sp. L-8-3]|uniref:hypothetical protein n=1 Tax=Mesorhizobium sp. L-8-3 TaxID=2744522 RepID=UPI0019294876|nr:hypothetical protein [Mesorhizobium sp. L-8-3]BCH27722.1 hypothetical protein MesoLjLb_75070 [Mesorhizobium sp. L-8-3]